jgi:hypothetical protein
MERSKIAPHPEEELKLIDNIQYNEKDKISVQRIKAYII